ncbi:MAG: hypothetical protein Q9217_004147 [Psora testacea]
MTLSTAALPQPAVPLQHAACPDQSRPAQSLVNERGYSDSVLPSCRLSAHKRQQILMDAAPKVTASTATATATAPTQAAAAQPDFTRNKVIPLSNRMKAKQDLRLPSFHSLGISAPHPSALLTPPDESTLPDLPLASTSYPNHSRRLSFPPAPLPTTPDFVDLNTAPIQTTQSATSKQATTMSTGSHEIATPRAKGSTSSAIEGTEVGDRDTTWVSKKVIDGTTFDGLMSTLQERVDPTTYLEVTHAVPLKFNMGQVPNSPAITPKFYTSQPSTDYFSMQTFSKAVVALEYRDALESSVPSTPHPVVAPSTIDIALLERYIPPSSSNEYHDLFSTEVPSALVDRLTELSSNNGTLLFIYPTSAGAATFAHHYLSPLLDPLLRTMAGVHGLASDLGANIAKMAAIDAMLPFDGMTRKLNLLLRKLGRGVSGNASTARPPPKFNIVSSSVEKVVLGRKSWTAWWIHQEKERIQAILKRYFQRGYKLPAKDTATAGALCREILDGMRTRDEDACASLKGVEVGVFVIQRCA